VKCGLRRAPFRCPNPAPAFSSFFPYCSLSLFALPFTLPSLSRLSRRLYPITELNLRTVSARFSNQSAASLPFDFPPRLTTCPTPPPSIPRTSKNKKLSSNITTRMESQSQRMVASSTALEWRSDYCGSSMLGSQCMFCSLSLRRCWLEKETLESADLFSPILPFSRPRQYADYFLVLLSLIQLDYHLYLELVSSYCLSLSLPEPLS